MNMEDTRRGLPERQAWSRIRMRVTIMCRSWKHVMKEIIQIRTFNVTNLVENAEASGRQQKVYIKGVMVNHVPAELNERWMLATLECR